MLTTFLIIMTVLALAVLGGTVWGVNRAVRWTAFVLRGPPAAAGAAVGFDADRRCGNRGCRTANPPHAKFCRRCGSTLNPSAVRPGPSGAGRLSSV